MEVFRINEDRRFSPERPNRLNILDRPRVVADLVCLEPDQEMDRRENTVSDEVYLVLEGRAHIRVGAQAADLDAHEGVLIPPGVQHGIKNPGPGRLTALVFVA